MKSPAAAKSRSAVAGSLSSSAAAAAQIDDAGRIRQRREQRCGARAFAAHDRAPRQLDAHERDAIEPVRAARSNGQSPASACGSDGATASAP